MAISPGFIAAQPVAQNYEVYIELLGEQPSNSLVLSTAKPPGQLVGYYNAVLGIVELYIVAASGLRLVRVS